MGIPVDLCNISRQGPAPLPEWARFFIDLGWDIANAYTKGERLILAIAVPTRAYASALIATGFVLSRASENRKGQNTDEEYFKQLWNLPIDTPVYIDDGEKRVLGKIKFHIDKAYDNHPRIGIQVQHDRCRRNVNYLPINMCRMVEPFTDKLESIPKSIKSVSGSQYNRFVRTIVQDLNIWDFSTKSCLECLILGDVGVLRQEVNERAFTVKGTQGYLTGALFDILRVRRFSGQKAYRSNVIPVRGNKPPATSDGSVPQVVIFDGARGFLKWRDNWRHTNWVILLDRTEAAFLAAVQEVNTESLSRHDNEIPLAMSALPAGVELIAYQETQ